jgi:hypothetical protein
VDLVVELPPGLRLMVTLLSLAGLAALVAAAVAHARSRATPAALARQLDEVGQTRGQIHAGVDLALHPQVAGVGGAVSAGLSQMAVARAAALAERIHPTEAVPSDAVRRPFKYLAMLCGLVAVVAIGSPRLISTQVARFTDPWGDHPPYSRLSFDVTPGAANVIYGKSLDVQVRTSGAAQPEQVELVRLTRGSPAGGSAEEVVPMFAQTDGKWQATLAGVTEPGQYFVRAGRARSHRYDLSVTTVPKIEQVRFRITPPAYTRGAAYEGPLPQQGLSGLPGTKVEVWAKSNRPLSGGGVQIARAGTAAEQPAGTSVGLEPTAANSDEVRGEFTIATAGRMTLNVKDVAGQPSTEAFAASITPLADNKPFARVLEPRQE